MKAPAQFVVRPFLSLLAIAALLTFSSAGSAQENASAKSKQLYDQLKAFSLTGGSASVQGLVLQRDRAYITFTGDFYFAAPVAGRVTGAVFIGEGKFLAAVPPSEFEKDNVKRLLNADIVESSFKTAVLRFSDDTFEHIGKQKVEGGATPQAAKLAAELEPRVLKETGANLSARIAISILNNETPGFFFGMFDGGRRQRFSFLLDHQTRIPVANFNLNAGDKGLIYRYRSEDHYNEIWLAFASLEDFQKGVASYSDLNDQIDIAHYNLDVDLLDHKNKVRLFSKIDAQARFPNQKAIYFRIGEWLTEEESIRLQKQMRIKLARVGGVELSTVQEDWEGGATVFLESPIEAGKQVTFELLFEGDFMHDAQGFIDRNYSRYENIGFVDSYYPRSTTSWYPRHGYLDRATYDLTFHHPRKLHVASIGSRLSEAPDVENKNASVTSFRMSEPVALATFALGPFEIHKQNVRWDQGGSGDPLSIEFSSLPGSVKAIKEDFILAEMDNSLRYFTMMFGKYPYSSFGGAYHPYFFGQGFPGLLMIPAADSDNERTFSFIAHETAHQWWGNIVAWRSYRDQWLSEGFAEYSGVLYTELRDGTDSRNRLLRSMRESLTEKLRTEMGFAKERPVDVGPIILGHRLDTRKTPGAYQTLIYNKGALVLRMLHFLFTDPVSGDGKAFFTMMTDFVSRYRNDSASTDDFRRVANEHFAKTPIARGYRINNLDWFFKQWVYQSAMPSYRMEYHFEDQPNGKVKLTGTVTQENAGENWLMVLPVVFDFGGKQQARSTVHAYGPTAQFQIILPARPRKVELDPDHWIIAEKISTKGP
jgi:hypothetical protein